MWLVYISLGRCARAYAKKHLANFEKEKMSATIVIEMNHSLSTKERKYTEAVLREKVTP